MEEIDIKEMIFILLRKKAFIIGLTILFAVVCFAFCITSNYISNKTQSENPLYYAETSFIIGTSETMNAQVNQNSTEDSASISISEQGRIVQTDLLFDTYFELLKSKSSLNKVIDVLDLDTDANSLKSLMYVTQDSESALLRLTVGYKDKEKVVQIADKLISEFINNMEKAYETDKVAIIDKAYLLENSELSSSSAVQAINPATSYNTSKCTIISTCLGFIISVGFVLLKEMFDDTIKDESFIETISNSKNIVKIDKSATNTENQFALLELRVSNMKTILISSPEENKELSYVSECLANTFSKAGNKVLLLEFNTNDYMLVKRYDYKVILDTLKKELKAKKDEKTNIRTKIKNKLENQKDNEETSKIQRLTSKSPSGLFEILYINPIIESYLNEKQLRDFVLALEEIYDTIIINSDNILNSACAYALSKAVDNVLMVSTERKTKTQDFSKVVEELENIKEYVLLK